MCFWYGCPSCSTWSPGPTARRLGAFNAWLRAHGRTVLVGVLVVVGAIMIFNGSYGLIAVQ